jgi:hypothetical protein
LGVLVAFCHLESKMKSSRRWLRLGALAALAGVVSGCVVLPFGPGHHGRHGRGDRYDEPPNHHHHPGDRRDRPRRGW